MRTLNFSGYDWEVRETAVASGPGPNRFCSRPASAWTDDQGLHLALRSDGKNWLCSQVSTRVSLGYGTYIFLLSSRIDRLDPNVILGLFSWNSESFSTDANSEVDIEFSTWGRSGPAESNSLYSVQPTGRDGEAFGERSHPFRTRLSGLASTHAFTWTSQWIAFASYHGHGVPTPYPVENWHFDVKNPPRAAREGSKLSKPIAIPSPGSGTRAAMNLWLRKGLPPTDGEDVEVIVKRFSFLPLT